VHTRPVLRLSAVVVALVLLGACDPADNGGGPLSKNAFIEQAEEICATSNARAAAVPPPSLVDPVAVERFIAEVIAIQLDALEQLSDLEPPEDDVPGINAWLATIEETLDEMENVRKGIRDGDQVAIDRANEAAVGLSNDAEDFAVSYGIYGCTTEEEPEVTDDQ